MWLLTREVSTSQGEARELANFPEEKPAGRKHFPGRTGNEQWRARSPLQFIKRSFDPFSHLSFSPNAVKWGGEYVSEKETMLRAKMRPGHKPTAGTQVRDVVTRGWASVTLEVQAMPLPSRHPMANCDPPNWFFLLPQHPWSPPLRQGPQGLVPTARRSTATIVHLYLHWALCCSGTWNRRTQGLTLVTGESTGGEERDTLLHAPHHLPPCSLAWVPPPPVTLGR